MGEPRRGGRGSRKKAKTGASQAELLHAAMVAKQDERGLFEGAMATLGRAGWVTRNLLSAGGNLLRGETDKAYEAAMNAASQGNILGQQVGSTLLTGGLSLLDADLTPQGLASKLTHGRIKDPDYLDTEASRMEFSDMLESLDIDAPDAEESPWLRFALDVAGGIMTDPLSLVGGTTGGVGSAGRGALAIGGRRAAQSLSLAERMGTSLGVTRQGRAMLRGSTTEQITEAAYRRSQSGASNFAGAARGAREFQGPIPAFDSISGQGGLQQAVAQLSREGAVAPTAMRVGVPFMPKAQVKFGLPGRVRIPDPTKSKARTALESLNPRDVLGQSAYSLINPFNRHFLMAALGGAAGHVVGGPVGGMGGAIAGNVLARLPIADDLLGKAAASFTRNLVSKYDGVENVPQGVRDEATGVIGWGKSKAQEVARGAARYIVNAGVTPEEQIEALLNLERMQGTMAARRGVADEAEAWLLANGHTFGRTVVPPSADASTELARRADKIARARNEMVDAVDPTPVAQLKGAARKKAVRLWEETNADRAKYGIVPLERPANIAEQAGTTLRSGHPQAGRVKPKLDPKPRRGTLQQRLDRYSVKPWAARSGRPAHPQAGREGLKLPGEGRPMRGGEPPRFAPRGAPTAFPGIRGGTPAPKPPTPPVEHWPKEGSSKEGFVKWYETQANPVEKHNFAEVYQKVQDSFMPGYDEWRTHLLERAGNSKMSQLGAKKIANLYDWYLGTTLSIHDDMVDSGIWAQRSRDLEHGDVFLLPKGKKAAGRKLGDFDNTAHYSVRESLGGNHYRVSKLGEGRNAPTQVMELARPARDAGVSPYRILTTKPYQVEDMFYARRDLQPWVEKEFGERALKKFHGYLEKAKHRSLSHKEYEELVRDRLLAVAKSENRVAEVQKKLERLGEHGLTVNHLGSLALDQARRHYPRMAKRRLMQLAQDAPEYRDFLKNATTDVRRGLGKFATSETARIFTEISRRWKGLYTAANTAFGFRNYLSTLPQAMQIPGVTPAMAINVWAQTGLQGFHRMGQVVANKMIPNFKAIDDSVLNRSVNAAYGDGPAWDSLSGVKVGGEPVRNLIHYANGRLFQQNAATRDVLNNMLGKELRGELLSGDMPRSQNQLAGFVDYFLKKGADASSFAEDRMRFGLFMQLVGNGVNKERALTMVNRGMVDYELQSVADYWFRQTFPFHRFGIATFHPAMRALRDNPVYREGHRVSMETARDDPYAPENARRGFAPPTPFGGGHSYVQGLGSPLQPAADLLSAVPYPKGEVSKYARRGSMGQLHPMLQAPLSGALNVDPYWGGDYWRPRVVKGAEADLFRALGQTRFDPDKNMETIDPALNRGLGANPFGRWIGGARTLLRAEDRGDFAEAAFKTLTGVRTTKADRRELVRLIDDYMARRRASGDTGVHSRYYANPGADPQLQRLMETYTNLSTHNRGKKKKKRKPR